ncbi:UNKNOWN [Stylonychia lemnae]|uniref:Uncharacterized protein n=1 Tax=Stylonychia lemnae TaxID=5949 RepID=A0A078B988_STYLE|nr:UNKNOWN [Stylonychia lemnae]|eukprot:CDW89832.1 UNKNOWN [Stylonychia lemnae]
MKNHQKLLNDYSPFKGNKLDPLVTKTLQQKRYQITLHTRNSILNLDGNANSISSIQSPDISLPDINDRTSTTIDEIDTQANLTVDYPNDYEIDNLNIGLLDLKLNRSVDYTTTNKKLQNQREKISRNQSSISKLDVQVKQSINIDLDKLVRQNFIVKKSNQRGGGGITTSLSKHNLENRRYVLTKDDLISDYIEKSRYSSGLDKIYKTTASNY